MIVNGNDMICEPEMTLRNMLEKLNLDEDKVVVEINLEIVSRKSYKNLFLNEEDKIEIVSFVGGGWYEIWRIWTNADRKAYIKNS